MQKKQLLEVSEELLAPEKKPIQSNQTDYDKVIHYTNTIFKEDFETASKLKNFTNANFQETDLSFKNFIGADFTGADLKEINIKASIFNDTTLNETNFKDANLNLARLKDIKGWTKNTTINHETIITNLKLIDYFNKFSIEEGWFRELINKMK